MVRKSSICCIGFVILILIIAVVLRAVNGIDGAIAPLFVEFIGICTTMIVGMQLVSVVTLLSMQKRQQQLVEEQAELKQQLEEVKRQKERLECMVYQAEGFGLLEQNPFFAFKAILKAFEKAYSIRSVDLSTQILHNLEIIKNMVVKKLNQKDGKKGKSYEWLKEHIYQYKFDDAYLNHQLSYDVNRIIKEVSDKMTQNNKL